MCQSRQLLSYERLFFDVPAILTGKIYQQYVPTICTGIFSDNMYQRQSPTMCTGNMYDNIYRRYLLTIVNINICLQYLLSICTGLYILCGLHCSSWIMLRKYKPSTISESMIISIVGQDCICKPDWAKDSKPIRWFL